MDKINNDVLLNHLLKNKEEVWITVEKSETLKDFSTNEEYWTKTILKAVNITTITKASVFIVIDSPTRLLKKQIEEHIKRILQIVNETITTSQTLYYTVEDREVSVALSVSSLKKTIVDIHSS